MKLLIIKMNTFRLLKDHRVSVIKWESSFPSNFETTNKGVRICSPVTLKLPRKKSNYTMSTLLQRVEESCFWTAQNKTSEARETRYIYFCSSSRSTWPRRICVHLLIRVRLSNERTTGQVQFGGRKSSRVEETNENNKKQTSHVGVPKVSVSQTCSNTGHFSPINLFTENSYSFTANRFIEWKTQLMLECV